MLAQVRNNLGRILTIGFAKYVLVMIGYAFCVIPGIYISVPFLLLFAIAVFRNIGVSQALTESFNLIKDEWWITFATIIVGGLIWYVINIAFSIPSMIYTAIKTMTIVQEGSLANPEGLFDATLLTITVIVSILQYVSYFFIPIMACFVYHNLNERKNQTGTLERIDSIGA